MVGVDGELNLPPPPPAAPPPALHQPSPSASASPTSGSLSPQREVIPHEEEERRSPQERQLTSSIITSPVISSPFPCNDFQLPTSAGRGTSPSPDQTGFPTQGLSSAPGASPAPSPAPSPAFSRARIIGDVEEEGASLRQAPPPPSSSQNPRSMYRPSRLNGDHFLPQAWSPSRPMIGRNVSASPAAAAAAPAAAQMTHDGHMPPSIQAPSAAMAAPPPPAQAQRSMHGNMESHMGNANTEMVEILAKIIYKLRCGMAFRHYDVSHVLSCEHEEYKIRAALQLLRDCRMMKVVVGDSLNSTWYSLNRDGGPRRSDVSKGKDIIDYLAENRHMCDLELKHASFRRTNLPPPPPTPAAAPPPPLPPPIPLPPLSSSILTAEPRGQFFSPHLPPSRTPPPPSPMSQSRAMDMSKVALLHAPPPPSPQNPLDDSEANKETTAMAAPLGRNSLLSSKSDSENFGSLQTHVLQHTATCPPSSPSSPPPPTPPPLPLPLPSPTPSRSTHPACPLPIKKNKKNYRVDYKIINGERQELIVYVEEEDGRDIEIASGAMVRNTRAWQYRSNPDFNECPPFDGKTRHDLLMWLKDTVGIDISKKQSGLWMKSKRSGAKKTSNLKQLDEGARSNSVTDGDAPKKREGRKKRDVGKKKNDKQKEQEKIDDDVDDEADEEEDE